ncbi:MAG: RtcB family protein [Flavipsychrobacter sp.]
MTLKGTDIIALGYEEGEVVGTVLQTISTHYADTEKADIEKVLTAVLENPNAYVADEKLGAIAATLLQPKVEDLTIPLRATKVPYKTYGIEGIEQGAIDQMEVAMRLPIAKSGALMADAHQGYGLPIGGVLATENAVIPYGVGVDIGCRMCMSIYDIPAGFINTNTPQLKKMLKQNTQFGRATFKRPREHDILSNPLFDEIDVVKRLKDRAYQQLGTSGGGNHFVEFGIAHITDADNEFGIKPGKYLALLSHSGSRGLGASIANHYTKLARELCKLPDEAKHLAWLDLDTEAGQEYWLAMTLAGDYASACHHQIHERMAIGLRTTPLAMVENHHNFAWKEKDEQGNELIVHRKGATPAGKGVLGIIPGSMTAPGFIVRGKGETLSVNSASHGAGRTMSRTQAKKTLDPKMVSNHLAENGIELIGSGLDEAPQAYKDIHQVMDAQIDLVDVVGTFLPKIVRMCGDEKFKEVD